MEEKDSGESENSGVNALLPFYFLSNLYVCHHVSSYVRIGEMGQPLTASLLPRVPR